MSNDIRKKIAALDIEKRAFINGQFVASISGQVIEKVSPVDGRDLSGLSACAKEDVDLAVAAAETVFQSGAWKNTALQDKKQIMFTLAELMQQHLQEFALLDTLETGRAFNNYYSDSIPKAIQALRYFAEAVDKCYEQAVFPQPGSMATVSREALGVVGLITPWNDPMVVSMWKVIPALLMGNSVIIKPAEQSSFSILLFAKLAQKAGIPDGVFNVVTGYGETAGKAIALHMDVAGLFFTGSSETGKMILQYSGQSNMKKVGLECGGKSPFLVSKKCRDLVKAAKTLAKNMFYNQGQICSAPSRLILDQEIKEKFLVILREEYQKYAPKDPFQMDSQVGCVVSKEQQQRVERYIEKGIQSGLEVYRADDSNTLPAKSCYVLPTIFVLNDALHPIAQEEIFGPVLVVIEASNLHHAISLANASKYGLAASIWTDDLSEAHWAANELQAGIVHINSYGEDDNSVPFGGIKESGIGKDKSLYAFDEYSYIKTTWINYGIPKTSNDSNISS